ncbi:MAG: RNA 2',3'-cyclic phosphodiesterase [Acidimicrobiia bacterium]|jgi:RNA 2',3'-cyclic 3'-phosphodiesterase
MVEGVAARIFVAVPLPDELRMALADCLRPFDIPGKVVSAQNWHITLRFLGWTDDVAFDRMLASLDETDFGPGFDVRLGEMGAFPRPRRATVIWLAASRGLNRLEELAAAAEEAAQSAGFGPEDRPFRAHLTLSRVRPAEDVSDLVESFPGADLGWRCESVVVYRSHLGRGGARYEPLETFPLSR